MASISAYDSNSISVLFSSLPGASSGGVSSLSSLTSSLADYNLVRSGSYRKLMNSYFAKTDAKEFSKAFGRQNTKTNSTSKDSPAVISQVKSAAEGLEESASELLKSGTGSAFRKLSSTDSSGNRTNTYDTDKIYSAVKAFVNDYNEVVKAADSSSTSGIQKTTVNMINYTSRNEKALNNIGITIDSSNYRLSIDEEKFKSSDMGKVKSLFNGAGSYAYNVKSQASMIKYKADNEASRSNTYTDSGSYSSAYAAGSMWDSFF